MLPVVYIPHGGGPWPFVELGLSRAEIESLTTYLESLGAIEARALLVISAHWEAPQPTVMTSPHPPMLFDYYGFPQAAYQLSWPAPGSPELAGRVRELLADAGIDSREDAERGFDHGTFVPLMLSHPDAAIPCVQLSLQAGLDPARHLEIGRALAPLRDEGVLIVGSGMSFHDLRALRDPRAGPTSATFDAWLRETVTLDPAARDDRLLRWSDAPAGRASHPREEHLLPLMVIAGAAGSDPGAVAWSGTFAGWHISAAQFGAGAG